MIAPLSKSVLVDQTFFDALLRPDHPRRAVALVRYEELLADYESGSTLIVTHDHALAETVDPARARRIAAICDVGPIDGDVRREIRRIRADQTALVAAGLDDSQLATIVLLVRRHLDELVSFDPAVREAAIAERRLRTGDAGRRFRTRLWGRVLGFGRSQRRDRSAACSRAANASGRR